VLPTTGRHPAQAGVQGSEGGTGTGPRPFVDDGSDGFAPPGPPRALDPGAGRDDPVVADGAAPNRHRYSPQLPCRPNRLHEISEILSPVPGAVLHCRPSPSPGRSIDGERWRGDRQARGDRPSRGIAAALADGMVSPVRPSRNPVSARLLRLIAGKATRGIPSVGSRWLAAASYLKVSGAATPRRLRPLRGRFGSEGGKRKPPVEAFEARRP